jgi:hypothetical protein
VKSEGESIEKSECFEASEGFVRRWKSSGLVSFVQKGFGVKSFVSKSFRINAFNYTWKRCSALEVQNEKLSL